MKLLSIIKDTLLDEGLNLPKKKFPDKITGDYPNGNWYRYEYDNNGKEIYYENSNGYWVRREYDNNGKKIYFENSNGYWSRREYDNNGKEIYYENSNGNIRDNRPGINEGLNLPKKKYPDKIEGDYPNGNWSRREYDNNGKQIYYEDSNGYWERYEYDNNGKQIYFEASDGYWSRHEYDNNGNLIYYENSDGYWERREYDTNGNVIYYEDSDVYWERREFDNNGNEIYSENSDGNWSRHEYDNNGNLIYFVDSDGNIVDNRPVINEGLNLPKKNRYIINCMGDGINISVSKYILNRLIDDEYIVLQDGESNIYYYGGTESELIRYINNYGNDRDRESEVIQLFNDPQYHKIIRDNGYSFNDYSEENMSWDEFDRNVYDLENSDLPDNN
jgi:uncharacterized protein RhaS with RHS repeats